MGRRHDDALEVVRSRAVSEVTKVKQAIKRVTEEHERATLAKERKSAARHDAASVRRLEQLRLRMLAAKALAPATPREMTEMAEMIEITLTPRRPVIALPSPPPARAAKPFAAADAIVAATVSMAVLLIAGELTEARPL